MNGAVVAVVAGIVIMGVVFAVSVALLGAKAGRRNSSRSVAGRRSGRSSAGYLPVHPSGSSYGGDAGNCDTGSTSDSGSSSDSSSGGGWGGGDSGGGGGGDGGGSC